VKIRHFSSDPDKFDDLFEMIPKYSIIKELATERLSSAELLSFKQYCQRRNAHLPEILVKHMQQELGKEEAPNSSSLILVIETKINIFEQERQFNKF